ncbi:hypothetical protein SBI_04323 [Streptomyces bingchenggensis BCW-1]|uniref:Uncharacterized protein n=1 Tax=Streptomyces bingchenggensis (strain BCW-1) TaxID=749414 RepID=D7BTK4_STRBB|nr:MULTISPECIES: hypothetical protein [Streptomyces]ADI07443.1 hypothetical protein SBI_04323 [Streptomyces bingchenggensis BCW-1]
MATVSPQTPTTASFDFDQEACALVLDTAPRMFAVVQEYDLETEHADGHVAAWGMAYGDGSAHVIGVGGAVTMSLGSPERAVWHYGRRKGVSARLVWLAPGTGATFARAEAA